MRFLRMAAAGAALGLASFIVGAAGCDSADLTYGDCTALFGDQCGTPCGFTPDCPAGLYCTPQGTCTADCGPEGSACDGGTCNEHGQCGDFGQGGAGGAATSSGTLTISVGQGGNQQGAGGGQGGQGGSCGEVSVDFEPLIPTVILLIDQSGSMDADFNGQGERWDVVYDVLMDPNDGVVKSLEGQVRFGLSLYSYGGGQKPAPPSACPVLTPVFPPKLNNHADIDAVYAPAGLSVHTPTGDSLALVASELAGVQEPGPKIIILATDGDPDSCADHDAHNDASKQLTVDAAEAAFADDDIKTFIIAVGDQVSGPHQQDVANAGQGLPTPAADPCTDPATCAPTYEPSTKQEMIDAFNEIIQGERSCIFDLSGEVIAGKECEGEVTLNGTLLGCNQANGWQLNSASQIEFLGDACDTIKQDSNVSISASFPCNTVINGPN